MCTYSSSSTASPIHTWHCIIMMYIVGGCYHWWWEKLYLKRWLKPKPISFIGCFCRMLLSALRSTLRQLLFSGRHFLPVSTYTKTNTCAVGVAAHAQMIHCRCESIGSFPLTNNRNVPISVHHQHLTAITCNCMYCTTLGKHARDLEGYIQLWGARCYLIKHQ